MPRNLCRTVCGFCGSSAIVLEEEPRPISKAEGRAYFEEFEGMLVANARCDRCLGKYLAWVDERPRLRGTTTQWMSFWRRTPTTDRPFFDLSYRSTFDDEPGPDDQPSLVTGISVEQAGERDHVHVSIRGVTAGILVVERGDGPRVASLLNPASDLWLGPAAERYGHG